MPKLTMSSLPTMMTISKLSCVFKIWVVFALFMEIGMMTSSSPSADAASSSQSALPSRDAKYCKSCKKTITCPAACPKMHDVRSTQLCDIRCGEKCNATCRINGCKRKGAICGDPRFVAADGSIFYFHGKADEDFCILSDTNLHINGHFIGKRVLGRPRDFTWVQGIAILYGAHQVRVSSKKAATWNDTVDHIELVYDAANISLPTRVGEVWTSPSREFTASRTDDLNSIQIEIADLLKVSIRATYIDEQENKIHGYQINHGDCFTHLDLHFTFFSLSNQVSGVLGQTYRSNYINKLKVDVDMPIMGGYEKYRSSSLFSPDCQETRFNPLALSQMDRPKTFPHFPVSCTGGGEGGIICRR